MAKHVITEDILKKQAALEREFLKDFHENDYTFDHPKIVTNPYQNNPCAALILFQTEKPVAVTVEVVGKTSGACVSHTYAPTTTHIHPILGLYDAAKNTVNVTLYQGRTKSFTIETTGHPDVTKVESVSGKTQVLNGKLVVVTPAMNGFPTGIDGNGDIRWYISQNLMFAGKKCKNGHLLIGTDRKLVPPYYVTGLYEMDMIGKIYREYRIPGLYHHDQTELPNGDLAVLTQKFGEGSDSVEDMCVIVNRKSGEVIRTIDYKNFMPRGYAASKHWTKTDWFHNNSLAYDKYNNSLSLSSRHMDCLVNIDFDTEKINWIIGDPTNWPKEFQKYFFTPPDTGEFGWQYEQHAVTITPNGDVMCFDNGTRRSKEPDKGLKNSENYSRGVRYRINTTDHTIRQVWQYGKERGPEFFSQFICNIEYYQDGHYLVHSGGIQRDENGVNVEGIIPPEKRKEADMSSTVVEVYDNEVVWEMRIKNNFYRAHKMDLYADGSNLTLGDGSHSGYLGALPESESQPFVPSDQTLPEEMMAHIIEEFDCFTLKIRIPDDTKAFLFLKKENEEKAFPINTAHNPFGAVSGMPYLPNHPDNKSLTFTKTGLCGTYHVWLSVEDQLYDCGIEITGEP